MADHAAAGICFFAYVSRPVFDGASDEQKIVSRLLFNYTPIIKDSIKVYCLQGYFMKRKVLVKSSEGDGTYYAYAINRGSDTVSVFLFVNAV